MKPLSKYLYFLCVLIGVFFAGMLAEFERAQRVVPAPTLPGPMDLQRQIVALGYEIKVDGKIGPQTIAAWAAAYGNQSAARYFPKEIEK